MERNRVFTGDALDFARELEPQSVQCIVTSPPYFGLRAYLPAEHPDKARELGGEPTPEDFIAALVAVFRALLPALKDDGTLWLNLGDSYANDTKWGGATGGKHAAGVHGGTGIGRAKVTTGYPPKCLMGIPWRVALALIDAGWTLRSEIIWHKPAPMPESVTDRPTRAHEQVFLFSKGPRYFYDAAAVAEPAVMAPLRRRTASPLRRGVPGQRDHGGLKRLRETPEQDRPQRNRRSVWTVNPTPFPDAHYATFPPELIRPCILAGSRVGDVVCDPFGGSGTTALVAVQERRQWVLCDIDARSVDWTAARLAGVQTRLAVAP